MASKSPRPDYEKRAQERRFPLDLDAHLRDTQTTPPKPATLLETEGASLAQAYWIDIDRIRPDPKQPRKKFDERSLRDLGESMRATGQLQPVLVRRLPDGAFQLITGERRLRAVQLAGMPKILAVLARDDVDSLKAQLHENLYRRNLTDFEYAQAISALREQIREELGTRVPEPTSNEVDEELGRYLGISGRMVRNYLALLRLPPEIRRELGEDAPELQVRAIVHLNQYPNLQLELARTIRQFRLSSRKAMAVAKELRRWPHRPVRQVVAAVLGFNTPEMEQPKVSKFALELGTHLSRALALLEMEEDPLSQLDTDDPLYLQRLLTPLVTFHTALTQQLGEQASPQL
ncbi:MAG: ParB/RepB/Spo0J family partition protein [Chloroflexi bacterium]|nr:ParB/RepB/Spo0J family partition protein [Chloroflexota bacterium]